MDRHDATPPATYRAGLRLARGGRADSVKERLSMKAAHLHEPGKRPRIAHRAGDGP